jgi:tartrate dehydrogenase/decarboxylase/D-malate dehydrogenase
MTTAPRTFRIAAIPADGVGKEVVAAGRAVLSGRSSPGAAGTTSAPAG